MKLCLPWTDKSRKQCEVICWCWEIDCMKSNIRFSSVHHHVKQPASVRSRVRRRKAFLALLDQLTSFGQRESLTIHASIGSGRMSAVSSAQSVDMLQSVAARWRCKKWFGNWRFPGGGKNVDLPLIEYIFSEFFKKLKVLDYYRKSETFRLQRLIWKFL